MGEERAAEGRSLLSKPSRHSLLGSHRSVSIHGKEEHGHAQVQSLSFDALREVARASFEELRKDENTSEVTFDSVHKVIKEKLHVNANNQDFLKEFDKDGSGMLDFNEFLHIIVQVDLMGRISDKRQEEFRTSMWKWQIAKLTEQAWEAQKLLKEKFKDTPDYAGIDSEVKTTWLQETEELTKELEKIWSKVDPLFFQRALRSLPEEETIKFLDSLVFQIELKHSEDYLKLGLGKPGETLPSQTLCPSACVYMVEAKDFVCEMDSTADWATQLKNQCMTDKFLAAGGFVKGNRGINEWRLDFDADGTPLLDNSLVRDDFPISVYNDQDLHEFLFELAYTQDWATQLKNKCVTHEFPAERYVKGNRGDDKWTLMKFDKEDAPVLNRIIVDDDFPISVYKAKAKFPIKDDRARVPFYHTDLIQSLTHGQDALPWFGYTTVNISPADLRTHPQILMLIAYSGATSDVTNRIFVRGLLNRAWDDVQASFLYTIARECIFALMLLAIPHYARRQRLPPTALVLALLALAIATLSHTLLEIAGGLHAAMLRANRREGAVQTPYSFAKALSKVLGVFCLVGLLIVFTLTAINTAREDQEDARTALLALCGCAGSIASFSIFVAWTYMAWPPKWTRLSNVATWASLSLILFILSASVIDCTKNKVVYTIDHTERGIYSLILFFLAILVAATICALFKSKIFEDKEVRALKAHILVGSFWTIFEIFMAVYGVALISGFIYFGWSNHEHMHFDKSTEGAFTYEHPSWTAAYVCFKIQQVIQKTLCARGLGENVIPAYNALFDSASTRVIMFMLLLWLNSFCTYYAFPVQLVEDSFWGNIWMMAVSMYRLDLSGDFDLNDLEGLNPRIVNVHKNGSTPYQAIENDTDFKPWHNAISAMYMVFFLFMNVGLLNVYIGIVSEQYTEKRKRRKEFFETYRAAYIYKIIVMRAALEEIWKAIVRPRDTDQVASNGTLSSSVSMSRDSTDMRASGTDVTPIWLMFDPTLEDTRSPSNTLSELEASLKRESEKSKDLEKELAALKEQNEALQKRAEEAEADNKKHRDGFWEKILKENKELELKAKKK